DCGHHRPRPGGLAQDGAAAAILGRLRLAPRRRDHGAGLQLHGPLRCDAGAPAVETTAGDQLRNISAVGVGALRREPFLNDGLPRTISVSPRTSRRSSKNARLARLDSPPELLRTYV